jgi:hypothetical protein
VSAYDKDLERTAPYCFERLTGEPASPQALKTYHEALAQYHLHPEGKFHNGDYINRGVTYRRHIVASAVELIGKEANRWGASLPRVRSRSANRVRHITQGL